MPKGRQVQRNDMPEMVQFKLRPEELAEYETWTQRKGFSFDNILAEILLEGVKVGVSYDAYNDCFISSFTPKGDTHINAGSCLLSRSSTWQEAIALNVYKSQVIFANKRWVSRKEDDNRG
jgi:hypothetical protein